ncbi:MAG TPA: aldehyde ferredoxin oxidoreductase family protein [Bacillota bacterium]|jgi:aldehyde:ferredoxin oxidoreductase
MGLTAFINLTTGVVDVRTSDPKTLHDFVGSRGYAARLLYDLVPPEVEALDPRNHLVFSVGPLTGTAWPTSSRYTVTARSPLTNGYGYANGAGFFGPELRMAGFDALVVTGRADRPVYLLAEAGRVEIRPAGDLWGRTTDEAEKILRERHQGSRVASIGPAGENLVRFAAVINDYGRAAARSGMGAVMGSKKLKAVVAKAAGKVDVPKDFAVVAREKMEQVRNHPGSDFLRQWGTAALIRGKNLKGDLPSRNHQQVQFPEAFRVDAESLAKFVVKTRGCFACPIRCARVSRVGEGETAVEVEGPEYETIDAFGPLVGNADLETIIRANALCNSLGLDTISTGVVIAFAMECHEHGLLDDPAGSLEWGDKTAILPLVERIARRQGLGDLLAEGVKRAAERLGHGAEQYAMHVKGMEIPRQEPRVAKAFGLGHATSNRGADHLYAIPTIDIAGLRETAERLFPPEYLPEIMNLTGEKYKAEMVVFTEAFAAIVDSVGVCKFSTSETYALYPEDLAEGLSALGQEYTPKELVEAGERIVNLERMFNVRVGFSRADDRLPDRFTKTAATVYIYPDGRQLEADGKPVDMKPTGVAKDGLTIGLDAMLDRYYDRRGWTRDGIPTPDRLRSLGLDDLIGDLPRVS